MRSKKNGFTLIELLAVIVILSIIALIVTPMVLNIIEEVRISTFKINVQQLIKEAEKQFVLENVNKEQKSITFSNISNEQDAIELNINTNYNYKIQIASNNDNIRGYFAIDDTNTLSAYGEIPSSKIKINEPFISSHKVFFTENGIILADDMDIDFYKNISCDHTLKNKGYITYEDFYAIGDGKTNDAYAIYYAHECANKLNIPVVANKNTYYISHLPKASGILIKTDVNWNNSTIIIDDTVISDEEKKQVVFNIPVTKQLNTELSINYYSETKKVPEILDYIKSENLNSSSYYVGLISKTDKIYRANDSMQLFQEFYKSDYFKIDSEGNLLNKIRYNYNGTTTVNIYEIPDKTLKLENANFISIASKCIDSSNNINCSAVARRFNIARSNIEINNFNHYLADDNFPTYYGAGFLYISRSSNVLVKNSNFRAHLYKKNGYSGNAGGTYDISIANSSNITFDTVGYTCNDGESIKECYYKNMIDSNHYGITGNNNNKNWKIINSILNRVDSHQPSEDIYISSSILGTYSINVTGGGNLELINSSIDQAEYFIKLRTDYGSTWNGNIKINNIYFNTKDYNGKYPTAPRLLNYYISNTFNLENNGFGYQLYIPSIEASDIFINEKNLAESMDKYHNNGIDYLNNSSGIILVQNGAKNEIDTSDILVNSQKPILFGDMSFTNIRSDTFDKLKINYTFMGNSTTTKYTYKNAVGNIVTSNPWGVERTNINYYKNTRPININIDLSSLTNKSFTTYYKNYYIYDENNNLIEKSNHNAVNIITTSENHPYCEIKVLEQIQDDWYVSETLSIILSVPDGHNIIDYGLGYNTNSYNKTYKMTIPNSKKGAFNIYGYIKDDTGKIYNCIKLIKKAN